ncbi:Probable serine/threonine-protein kinase PkwA [Durusdinium trenchii]|uniref:Probable serine/threonine-protein kinase PkwA n=1 Tax=Durusdinium trenchii TaxID=1381693 RepID=A0ABP0LIV6_9DINO
MKTLLKTSSPITSLSASAELGRRGDTGRRRDDVATIGGNSPPGSERQRLLLPDPVLAVALAPPLRALLAAGGKAVTESSTVAVWDVDSGTLRAEMKYKHLVTSLAFAPALRVAITGDGSFDQKNTTGRVVLWNPDTLEQHQRLQCSGAVTCVRLTPDGLILSADRSRCICKWHPESGEKLQEIQVDHGLPWCLAVNEACSFFVYTACNFKDNFGCLCLRGEELEQYEECGHPVLSAVFLPEAPVIACGLRNGDIILWDFEVKARRKLVKMPSAVNALSVNLVSWKSVFTFTCLYTCVCELST